MTLTRNITGSLAAAFITLLLIAGTASATAVVRSASGGDLNIIPEIVAFTGDLGGEGHPPGGSYPTGYRSIGWDEVPTNVANYSLPPDFYNTTVKSGVMLSSACALDDLKVSASTSSGAPLHFGDYDPNYTNDFKDFSGPRLFSVNRGGCNYVDFYFYVPGTKTPATVKGFGIVFTDVDFNTTAGFRLYGIDGEPIGPRYNALGANNGLSFLGVSFNAGERIARVRVFSGTATLGEPDKSHGGSADVVVMDVAVYGEPRAIARHSADFDGDGISDLSVFRPSNGYWYVLQSGTGTVASMQFGAAGDIPVDGDFDGDSRNDMTVFRPSTGAWYLLRSSTGQVQGLPFGAAGDRPLGGDYDGDGISDISVWRPSDGNYYYVKSSNGQFAGAHFGANGDIPIGGRMP